jgi:hypothetical protein
MGWVVPWLLKREYKAHRILDPVGLPEIFETWRERQQHKVDRLAKLSLGRIVKLVIHPKELQAFAQQNALVVDEKTRTLFAEELWTDGVGRPKIIWRRTA